MKVLALTHVRRSFSVGVLSLCLATAASATIRTVSNGSVTAQYNNIAAAMTAASNGDTLYMYASGTSYGNVSVSKQLIFIGEVAWPLSGSDVARIGTLSVSAGGTGSVFISLRFDNTISIVANNIRMERCRFLDGLNMSGARDGLDLRHCYVRNPISLGNATNVRLENNVMCPNGTSTSNAPVRNSNQPTVLIRNNVFIDNGNTTSASLDNVRNAVLVNNIFHGAGTKFNNVLDCHFNNNLSWQVPTITALPPTGNTGTGNLVNADPQFVNVPATTQSNLYDYAIQAGSPAMNAGDDGTDMGITGGAKPWISYTCHPRLPRVTALTMPTSDIMQGLDLDDVETEGTKVD